MTSREETPAQEESGRKRAQQVQQGLAAFGATLRFSPEKLDVNELWWSNRFNWLKDRGYLLRTRYTPGWVPSWKTSGREGWFDREDSQILEVGHLIDATRLQDGKFVALKRVSKLVHPYEIDIGLYFSTSSLAAHPENHCVPTYEILSVDDNDIIIVMPWLRSYSDPPFDTFGEAVDCFRQLFEGLRFMHRHNVAHRDCNSRNLMLDPSSMYPESFHPMDARMKRDYSGVATYFTRTKRPPKYYLIDFGISRKYDLSETDPKEPPIWGGDKEVPEFQNSNEPCNPFPTDVFYIGNVIMKDFIQSKDGFDFMRPLVADMIQPDSSKRPAMDEVIARFDDIRRNLSRKKLRSRVVDHEEDAYERVTNTISYWKRRMWFTIRRIPPIPKPPS